MAIYHASSVPRRTIVHLAVLAMCVALLAYQVRRVDLAGLFADVDTFWLLGAVGAFALSLAAAAHNISAFAPLRLRAVDTLRAQLAVGGLRVVAPSAVSTPAIGIRFLTRKGLPLPAATAVLALAQSVQLLATVVVVGGLAALSASRLPTPPATTAVLVAAAVALVVAIAIPVARRVPRARTALADFGVAVRNVGHHLRERPHRVATGFGAAAALTAAHVAAFACCVHAVGGTGSPLALAVVYLGASGAGSLVPTPGGVGAVEAALIAGLVATGQSAQVATAAALLSRVVTVWAPAVPGLLALRSLRHAGAL